ncbi:uncharacterized protein LOC141901562 [Tubulanus polymorphus]|uniref:uncharacterized protein LOC141901562 n=1 Tax=Tubulanus polymorphus TaxID=672921 RepID=UPI003DA57227
MSLTLPIEVVTHIMRYLSVNDCLEASLVNRSWYEASLDPILQKNRHVTFHVAATDLELIESIGRRRIPNLSFHQIDNSSHSTTILLKSCRELSPFLRHLSFEGTDITERTFVSFLSRCYNLESLDLNGCNTLFMSGNVLERNADLQALRSSLQKLRELNLSSLRHITDATFNRLVTVVPNLESLNLSSCHVTFRTTNSYNDSRVCADNTQFSFANILQFVRSQSKRLTSLDLSKTNVNDDALSSIAKCDGLKLKSLKLHCCREISENSVFDVCKNQTELTTLDISRCTGIGNTVIQTIARYLRDLRTLDIRQCQYISHGIESIAKISSLRDLDIASTTFTSGAIEKVLSSPALSNLTRLCIGASAVVTDKAVHSICTNLGKIRYLDVNSCSNISDSSLHAISEHLVDLRYLDISWCKKVTDLGLLGLAEGSDCPKDQDDHTGCRCVRDHNMSTMFRKPLPISSITISSYEAVEKLKTDRTQTDKIYTLANLVNMETLKMKSLPNISDIGVTQAMKFSDLKYVDLSMCKRITDDSLVSLASNNRRLEKILISNCVEITNDGVLFLIHNCRRIVELDISNLVKITDHCVEEIAKYCRHLRHLDVSYCSYVTQKALESVEMGCKHLQALHCRYIADDDYSLNY